jgi:hypothetical protein
VAPSARKCHRGDAVGEICKFGACLQEPQRRSDFIVTVTNRHRSGSTAGSRHIADDRGFDHRVEPVVVGHAICGWRLR